MKHQKKSSTFWDVYSSLYVGRNCLFSRLRWDLSHISMWNLTARRRCIRSESLEEAEMESPSWKERKVRWYKSRSMRPLHFYLVYEKEAKTSHIRALPPSQDSSVSPDRVKAFLMILKISKIFKLRFKKHLGESARSAFLSVQKMFYADSRAKIKKRARPTNLNNPQKCSYGWVSVKQRARNETETQRNHSPCLGLSFGSTTEMIRRRRFVTFFHCLLIDFKDKQLLIDDLK